QTAPSPTASGPPPSWPIAGMERPTRIRAITLPPAGSAGGSVERVGAFTFSLERSVTSKTEPTIAATTDATTTTTRNRRPVEARAGGEEAAMPPSPAAPFSDSSRPAGRAHRRKNGRVALRRMDNVGIVVESLDAAIAFFTELGLELEGRAVIEGDWSGRVTGVDGQRVEIAMLRMPDGHGRIELSRFLEPAVAGDHRNAPVNSLGYLRVMFAVDDLDEMLGRLQKH